MSIDSNGQVPASKNLYNSLGEEYNVEREIPLMAGEAQAPITVNDAYNK